MNYTIIATIYMILKKIVEHISPKLHSVDQESLNKSLAELDAAIEDKFRDD